MTVVELAEPAVADHLAGQPEPRVAPLLAAGLEHPLVLLDRRDDPLPLVDGERQRLLAVDVLARLQRGQVDERVPVVGRAVDDDRDVLLGLQQLAEVGVDLRPAELLRRLRGAAGVHVADGDDGAEPLRVLGVAAAHAAAARRARSSASPRPSWAALARRPVRRRTTRADRPRQAFRTVRRSGREGSDIGLLRRQWLNMNSREFRIAQNTSSSACFLSVRRVHDREQLLQLLRLSARGSGTGRRAAR